MPTTTTKKQTAVVLKTRQSRSDFFRKEMRRQGMDIQALADAAGVCYQTVANFMQLGSKAGVRAFWTKDPRTNTTVSIAQALGWTITFRAAKEVGRIEL
jgi:hypothetical protein